MKRFALHVAIFVAAFSSAFSPSLHSEKNPADYPLRITILARRGVTHYYRGYADWHTGEGKGNIHDGDNIQGFDFSYECDVNFPLHAEGEYIPGRWKKNGSEIQVLFAEIGKPGKYHDCDMKLTLIDGVYRRSPNGALVAVPMAQYARLKAETHPADTDMKDFPLRASLVQVNWSAQTVGFTGHGSGNLKDGDQVQAFDFTTQCAARLSLSRPGTSFHARRIDEHTLQLIAHKTGDPQDAVTCDLRIAMQPFVYVRYASGQLQTYTQAQYANWAAKIEENPDAPPDPQILEKPFAK